MITTDFQEEKNVEVIKFAIKKPNKFWQGEAIRKSIIVQRMGKGE